jgi:hypothetical protein
MHNRCCLIVALSRLVFPLSSLGSLDCVLVCVDQDDLDVVVGLACLLVWAGLPEVSTTV